MVLPDSVEPFEEILTELITLSHLWAADTGHHPVDVFLWALHPELGCASRHDDPAECPMAKVSKAGVSAMWSPVGFPWGPESA